MAPAARKNNKVMPLINLNNLDLSDAFCYICRSVLIEPVSSPCGHVFCLVCFEQSMQETSYSCPLCRKRISNWVRSAKKHSKLVNNDLWTAIKTQFEEQVSLKLNGEDDGIDARLKAQNKVIPISAPAPGETAQEFNELLNTIQEGTQRIQDAQEKASVEFIQRLQSEEEEEYKTRLSAVTEKDEQIARMIQEEEHMKLKAISLQSSASKSLTCSASKQARVKGPLDQFFKSENIKPKNGLTASVGRSASSDSADSICSELHYFKPIKVAPKTPPKQWPDGKFLALAVRKAEPESRPFESKLTNSPHKPIQSPYSAFCSSSYNERDSSTSTDAAESPRKRLRFSPEPDVPLDSGVLKEINIDENSDSNPILTDLSHKKMSKLKEEQLRIEEMLRQEKADRDLALKLSKEWEQESRKKYSYELRRKPRRPQQVDCKKQQTLIQTLALRDKK